MKATNNARRVESSQVESACKRRELLVWLAMHRLEVGGRDGILDWHCLSMDFRVVMSC